MTIVRRHTDSRLTRVVVHNGIAHPSCLTAIDALLDEVGTSKSQILSATIWISDMQQKAAMDEVWIAWIDPRNQPTRATVRTDLGTQDTLVEIMVTAALS